MNRQTVNDTFSLQIRQILGSLQYNLTIRRITHEGLLQDE